MERSATKPLNELPRNLHKRTEINYETLDLSVLKHKWCAN